MEVWKDVEGSEGVYMVSNYGNVISCARTVVDTRTGTRTKKEKLLKCTVDSVGYQKVALYVGATKNVWKVHRLVAHHFCTRMAGNEIVNHLDNNKTNNRASNLEWTTPLGNNQHMCAQGRDKPPRGESSGTAKLSEDQIATIRDLCKTGIPQTTIAKSYGVCQQQVSRIFRKERWAHV